MDKELELMREQFALLNDKISKQKVVTDELISRIIKKSVSTVKRMYIIELVSALYVITFGSLTFWWLNFSWYFIAGTIALMLFCASATIFVGKDVFKNTMTEGSMLEVLQKALRVKRLEQRWIFIGVPLGLLWMLWVAWESYQVGNMPLIYGLSIGAVIGAGVGFFNYKKTIHALNDIVETIEEIEK